jgi:hypothetical protein
MQATIEQLPLLCNGLKSHLHNNREAACSARPVQSGYKDDFSREDLVEFRDGSLPEYELGSRGIELSRVFGIGLHV